MSKLLATDLDGTLFFPRTISHCICKRNRKFLQKWYDAGNKIVLITSRGPNYCDRLKEEIQRPFDVIACTSSHIIVDDKVVKETYIDKEDLPKVISKINEMYHPIAYLGTSKDHPLVIRNNSVGAKFLIWIYKLYWRLGFKRKEEFILDNDLFDEEIKKGNVYKIIVFFGIGKGKKKLSKEINSEIRAQFPNIEASWSSIIIEITPKGCNKGNGLQKYCEHKHIDPSDVIVAGDSGNDITMFNLYHENSYVMRKALPSVKKYAKHQISAVYKLGKIFLKEEK